MRLAKTGWILLAMISVALWCAPLLCSNGNGTGPSITVITQNVGDIKGEPTIESIVEVLRNLPPPDVFLLQEVGGVGNSWNIARRLGYKHIHHMLYADIATGGLVILSRREIRNPLRFHFKGPRRGTGVVLGEVEVGGLPVLVGNVHLSHIKTIPMDHGSYDPSTWQMVEILYDEMFNENARSQEARQLMDFIGALPNRRIILGGDFNAVPFTKAIRIMNERFRDALWPTLWFFSPTYRRMNSWVSPRIDYIFHSDEVKREEARIFRRTVGDHYPVYARFRL